MASNHVQVNGKFLRTGFTTGTAATAALYAAGVCLKTGQFLDCVEVTLPSGARLPRMAAPPAEPEPHCLRRGRLALS